MKETLLKLFIEKWQLPEEQAIKFINDLFAEKEELSLEELREASASLLQEVVLKSLNRNLD